MRKDDMPGPLGSQFDRYNYNSCHPYNKYQTDTLKSIAGPSKANFCLKNTPVLEPFASIYTLPPTKLDSFKNAGYSEAANCSNYQNHVEPTCASMLPFAETETIASQLRADLLVTEMQKDFIFHCMFPKRKRECHNLQSKMLSESPKIRKPSDFQIKFSSVNRSFPLVYKESSRRKSISINSKMITRDYRKSTSSNLSKIPHPESIRKASQNIFKKELSYNLYYAKKDGNSLVIATEKQKALCDQFEEGLLKRKKGHREVLHPELLFNIAGEYRRRPLCNCSREAKRSGIKHNFYVGELGLRKCNVNTNNAYTLYHYMITISPSTNFVIQTPTVIVHDQHKFIFEGFSMFSHKPLQNMPVCKVFRFNTEYTLNYVEDKLPQNFTIRELDLFHAFLFKEILELVDLDFKTAGDGNGCSQFHFMPRFMCELPKYGKELLSMNVVLSHMLQSYRPLMSKKMLPEMIPLPYSEWQKFCNEVEGMVVTHPDKKPSSIRLDRLHKDLIDHPKNENLYPEIVHFGFHQVIVVSSEGFYRTGIMCDITQHALLLPVLVSHLRLHRSLDILECKVKYKFKHRSLLQLALTHESYIAELSRKHDHGCVSLSNCGIRKPYYGQVKIRHMDKIQRGNNVPTHIEPHLDVESVTDSYVANNKRLVFLGLAVMRFLSSFHLFYMLPNLQEGGLSEYRKAIVSKEHLDLLSKRIGLDRYMLNAHVRYNLRHNLVELRQYAGSTFLALIGAIFLDGGIVVADKVFGQVLFLDNENLLDFWRTYPRHPLQEEEPCGDRNWIAKYDSLQKLVKFEESIGVTFTHIRLLAKAFMDRSMGYTHLTQGSNQRLEFLGDVILELITAEYLYHFFPNHIAAQLSFIQFSLVSNKTLAIVCDDLGMASYLSHSYPEPELKTKTRADILEAFLGALYVDKGLEYCQTFCNVCLFPRLQEFHRFSESND